uniref:Uncharacterized protein n=1 Tax=Schlesneria paludicola TaxID=360056 RepID=A0A7C2K0A0_9PLAN
MSTPVLQALLVADHVYRDAGTGKHVICGVFSALQYIPKGARPKQPPPEGGPVPATHLIRAGSPYVYLSLTEVHGQQTFELRYVDLRDNSVLFSSNFGVKSQDPLQTVEVVLPLPVLPAPHPGFYALELLCEETLLGSHRVRITPDPGFATDAPPEPPPPAEAP